MYSRPLAGVVILLAALVLAPLAMAQEMTSVAGKIQSVGSNVVVIKDGWILRSEVVWHRPDHMPSRAKDRILVGHETVFLFSKSRHYWFDREAAIASGTRCPSATRRARSK